MSLKKLITFSFVCLLTIFSSSCGKQEIAYKFTNNKDLRIALVIPGPVNDSSWNYATYTGLKRFQTDYKCNISVIERVNLVDAKEVFLELAKRKFNLILANGYQYGALLKKVAQKYPDVFFIVIGGEAKQNPNLASFKFNDEQYGYLAGIVAGLNTSTNKVGIVVGKRIPTTERTIIGMREGLKSVNPKADLVVSYINSWKDIAKGKEAGIAQINTGIDVITHLADISGIGVIKAAEESDISVIGAITDQYDLAPTAVITSVIQDASQLVYLACENYYEKTIAPKIYSFGLKDQVIELAPSYGNIDPPIETKINRLKDQLADLESAGSN